MTWGVTDTGFIKKALTDILSEIESDEKALISPKLNTLATAVLGQINGIFADKLRELWDVAAEIYRSGYPDSASFDALDQVMALTGCIRLGPQKSRVTLDRLLLDPGAALVVGDIVSVGTLGNRFQLMTAVTNSTLFRNIFSATAESVDYGEVVGYAGTIDTIVTPETGWLARATVVCANSEPYNLDGLDLHIRKSGAHAPTVISFAGGNPWSAQDVANTVLAGMLGIETFDANGQVGINSDTDGEGSSIEVVGGTANAVLGFETGAITGMNSADADLGRETETDADARLRREQELTVTGAGTVDAIRARVLSLSYVVQCLVFENTTLTTVDGVPGKAFETVVRGGIAGDEQEIAETIWTVKPAGIQAYGTTNKTVVDSQSFSHTVGFSRPTEVPICLKLTVDAVAADFPADGEDQIKAALKALCDAGQIGQDVIALQYKATPLDIAGVEDVSVFYLDKISLTPPPPPPSGTGNIVIAARELATLDLTDIDLTMNWI